jgi:DNA-binding CsgD family transcriptional regulator
MSKPERSILENQLCPVPSPRAAEILKLASTGLTDKAIADRLGISPYTVDYYWRKIRLETASSSRTEAVARFLAASVEPGVESEPVSFRKLCSWPGV